MHFSKTATYSLNILTYMAKNDDTRLSASALHEELSIPYPYLRQILTNLSKNGLIHSARGRNGGYYFKRDIGTISLAEIIDATDGMEGLNTCILGFILCPFNEHCSMHEVWESTRTSIIKVLRETSLADVGKKR